MFLFPNILKMSLQIATVKENEKERKRRWDKSDRDRRTSNIGLLSGGCSNCMYSSCQTFQLLQETVNPQISHFGGRKNSSALTRWPCPPNTGTSLHRWAYRWLCLVAELWLSTAAATDHNFVIIIMMMTSKITITNVIMLMLVVRPHQPSACRPQAATCTEIIGEAL